MMNNAPPADTSASALEAFAGRAAAYASARPGYSDEAARVALAAAGLGSKAASSVVLELGAGTGLFTRPLAPLVERVIATEPEPGMRAELAAAVAADPVLRTRVSVRDGQAEATGVASHSIDAIMAAQALHWFDPVTAGAEFERVLKPAGRVVALWNDRRLDDDFARDLDQVLRRHAIRSLDTVGHMGDGRRVRVIDRWQALGWTVSLHTHVANATRIDADRLRGFLASASYLPAEGTAAFGTLVAEATALFATHGVESLAPWETVVFSLTPR
jgi:SAM-dependent methyltransferase